jgi:site-specific DNA recombinase
LRKLKKAIQYIRISQKDQSHFSIAGQQETNLRYAERQGIEILRTYIDDGESARDFDRPNWKSLMKDLEANKKNIDFLIVMKYDRLIRNAAQGLMTLEKIEMRWNIKVLSATEHLAIDPESPFFFKMRADMLVNAEFERRVISERSKFGVWRAKSEGRFIGKAPFGYENARDENNKPIIVVKEKEAAIINQVFQDYLAGIGFKDIISKYKDCGLILKGHSAVKRMLTNPVYAGLIEVPAFKDDVQRFVKGIHDPIVGQSIFFEASDKANGNSQKHTFMNDDVFLRGLVKCEKCKKKLTAGKSKGRSTYYWYYLCNYCRDENIRADKAHKLISEIMSSLTFNDNELSLLTSTSESQFNERMKSRQKEQIELQNKINGLQDKLNNLEEKYICDEIEKSTYQKWSNSYRKDLTGLQANLEKLQKSEDEVIKFFKSSLYLLKDLGYVFSRASAYQKQQLIRSIFSSEIELTKKSYRTAFVSPIFSDKANNIKGLDITEKMNKREENGLIPISTRSGT